MTQATTTHISFSKPKRAMSRGYYCFGQFCTKVITIFIRLNAAAFIKFVAFLMRRLFEGGAYFEITFLNLPKTVTVKSL